MAAGEGGDPDREIFLVAIAEAAEAVEIDGPHEAVAAFPFVQFCRCWTGGSAEVKQSLRKRIDA